MPEYQPNVSYIILKIQSLKQLILPNDLLSELSIKLIQYCMRVMAECLGGIREYKPHGRYAIVSLFCYFRSRLLTNSLVDLCMKLRYQIQTKVENVIDKKILSEVKCINGKFDIEKRIEKLKLINLIMF